MEIVDMGGPLPDPAGFDAMIVGSGNALRALRRRGGMGPVWFSKKLYAVGPRTAALAAEMGWGDVVAGPGRMVDLAAVIAADGLGTGRLLHLRGVDVRADPASFLPQAAIVPVIVYAAHLLDGLTMPVLEALEGRRVHGVLFYSARTAQGFMAAVKNSGMKADFSGVHALCIAPPVLESLGGVNWAGVHVAPTPDHSGMMSLIQSLKQL
jgi:uroporphyrinogen-III synthase